MNYIIFDLEATCDNNNDSFEKEIIEIGAVKISDTFEVVDTFNMFIRPVLNPILTTFCKELTSIEQQDVDESSLFPEVINSFKKWVQEDDYILMSWGDFDKNQLKKDCMLHGVRHNWITFKHVNLKQLHAERVLLKKKGVGMKKALQLSNLPLDGTHHRAIDDALNMTTIFLKFKDQLVQH